MVIAGKVSKTVLRDFECFPNHLVNSNKTQNLAMQKFEPM